MNAHQANQPEFDEPDESKAEDDDEEVNEYADQVAAPSLASALMYAV